MKTKESIVNQGPFKAKLTLVLEGHFPGSPERDSVELALDEYDELWHTWIKPRAIKEGWCGETPIQEAERKRDNVLKQAKELAELEEFRRRQRLAVNGGNLG